jgi:perosamine synthetase
MAATATAVLLTGATPVFVDIDADTLCMNLGAAEQSFSTSTRAVVFVSLNGRSPSTFGAFVSKCHDRGIRVIEDAAQSLGSYAGGRHLGTLGDCGCFSFSSQKLVTTGQGGAVVTDDEELFAAMHLLRDFGRPEGGSDRYLRVGWNLKFTDLQAVVGREQMRRLPELIRRKRQIAEWYFDGLATIRGVVVPRTDLTQTTPWFIDILVDPAVRDPLAQHLRSAGVGTRPFYPALHREPAFAVAASCPVAEDISARGLWLPSSLRLEREHIARICDAIGSFFTG